MSGARPSVPAVSEALARAAEWRLIEVLLSRPREGWIEEVESLAREVQDPELRAAARSAREDWADPRALEGPYLRTVGPGGSVSPREVTYRGREDPGAVLADLAALYDAFAYRPRSEDPADHVGVMAGFAGFLRLKEACALSGGDPDAARIAGEALDRFVASHLRPIAGPFARRIAAAASTDVAGAPAHLARAARCLVARAGDAPDPFTVLRTLDEESGPPACPAV